MTTLTRFPERRDLRFELAVAPIRGIAASH